MISLFTTTFNYLVSIPLIKDTLLLLISFIVVLAIVRTLKYNLLE